VAQGDGVVAVFDDAVVAAAVGVGEQVGVWE